MDMAGFALPHDEAAMNTMTIILNTMAVQRRAFALPLYQRMTRGHGEMDTLECLDDDLTMTMETVDHHGHAKAGFALPHELAAMNTVMTILKHQGHAKTTLEGGLSPATPNKSQQYART